MPNKTFDQKISEAGYCCPHAFIRILVRPQDSISKLAKMADVGITTIKRHRAAFRAGKCPCLHRNNCLRALWLLPSERKREDKLEEQRKLEAQRIEDATKE